MKQALGPVVSGTPGRSAKRKGGLPCGTLDWTLTRDKRRCAFWTRTGERSAAGRSAGVGTRSLRSWKGLGGSLPYALRLQRVTGSSSSVSAESLSTLWSPDPVEGPEDLQRGGDRSGSRWLGCLHPLEDALPDARLQRHDRRTRTQADDCHVREGGSLRPRCTSRRGARRLRGSEAGRRASTTTRTGSGGRSPT